MMHIPQGIAVLISMSGGATIAMLYIAEAAELVHPINLIEKLGMAGLVMVGGYFAVRFFQKENDGLKADVKSLHEKIDALYMERHHELKELLTQHQSQPPEKRG